MRSILLISAFTILSCGGKQTPSRWPARAEGCEVKIFHTPQPTMAVDAIGTAQAVCDQDRVSEADCTRELKDQACKIGADVLWDVPFQPTYEYGKQLWSGRAGHTK